MIHHPLPFPLWVLLAIANACAGWLIGRNPDAVIVTEAFEAEKDSPAGEAAVAESASSTAARKPVFGRKQQ